MAIIAAIDTSFVSMPNVNDLLIVWQTIKFPDQWWYFALMTTLGSVVGTQIIYEIGRRSGEAFLRKRFKAQSIARVQGLFERYGLLVMLVIAFAPPPAPYKIFVLLAGVGGLRPLQFAAAVAVGRGTRYLAEGWLARVYGEAAAAFIRLHLAEATIGLLGVVAVGGVTWWMWRRSRPA
jgi:membrane protein YqaA with SNARE-associated domain